LLCAYPPPPQLDANAVSPLLMARTRTDGRRFVTRLPRTQQAGNRDGRDDADDRHDDQQLDQGESFVLLQVLHVASPENIE
jgi:hypothetical protein